MLQDDGLGIIDDLPELLLLMCQIVVGNNHCLIAVDTGHMAGEGFPYLFGKYIFNNELTQLLIPFRHSRSLRLGLGTDQQYHILLIRKAACKVMPFRIAFLPDVRLCQHHRQVPFPYLTFAAGNGILHIRLPGNQRADLLLQELEFIFLAGTPLVFEGTHQLFHRRVIDQHHFFKDQPADQGAYHKTHHKEQPDLECGVEAVAGIDQDIGPSVDPGGCRASTLIGPQGHITPKNIAIFVQKQPIIATFPRNTSLHLGIRYNTHHDRASI